MTNTGAKIMTHSHRINNLKAPFENSINVPNVYVLFIPLTCEKSIDITNWNELAQQFGFNIIRERRTQATVEASPDQVKRLQESYPDIGITLRQQYKLSFA